MVMATGKSGRYRYYKCTARMKRGNAACSSGNIPMDKLDTLVLDAFKKKVFTPEHIRSTVDALRQQAAKMGKRDEKEHVKKLESQLLESEQALNRLYEGVEKGIMQLDEHLKDRLRQHKQTRESLVVEIANLKRQQQSPLAVLTPNKIEAVAKILNKRLSETSPFAKAYLKASLQEIRVTDDCVSLSGANAAMATLVANNAAITEQNGVPRFRGEWWT